MSYSSRTFFSYDSPVPRRVDDGLIVQSVACCRLGTTLNAAGPRENFTKIDKE
jgi:hypothetical protein